MRKGFSVFLIMSLMIMYLLMNLRLVRGNEVSDHKLIYFYSPYCSSCQQATPIIDKLSRNGIAIEKFDIQEPGSVSFMMQLLVDCDEAPSLAGQVPAFFYDNRVQIGFSGEEDLNYFLENNEPERHVMTNSLTMLGIFLAGLADGLNPCTLNVLLILLAIIANKDKSKLLQSGFVFVLGVTSVYFLLGLGLGHLVENIAFFRYVAPYMYIILGVGIIFSVSYDNHRFNKGAKFGLGKLIGRIREKSLSSPSVFVIGICSSLFEFVCTGQLYLPTVYYLSTKNTGGYVLRLLLYNVAFTIPMLLIIGLLYSGKKALGVQRLLKNINVTILGKFVMVCIGIYLIASGLLSFIQ